MPIQDMSHDLLLGDAAGELLAAALAADGVVLHGWRRTSIHPRGNDLSVLFTVEADGADASTFDLVVHVSSEPVPAGATILAAGGRQVHVWRVPHDPYLPGMAAALTPARVRELLDGLGAEAGPVTLTTRAYRPTRRAVVEVRIGEQQPRSVLYLKVLGGRTLNPSETARCSSRASTEPCRPGFRCRNSAGSHHRKVWWRSRRYAARHCARRSSSAMNSRLRRMLLRCRGILPAASSSPQRIRGDTRTSGGMSHCWLRRYRSYATS